MEKIYRVIILSPEEAEPISRAKECPYCKDFLQIAKKQKRDVLYDVDSFDIMGIASKQCKEDWE